MGVIRTFIDRQDAELVGGVVLREYLPLKLTGLHETSGMPLAEEVRVFCYQHQPLAQLAYWSGQQRVDNSDYQHLLEACQVIDNDFFSVDLALQADGRWVIIEIGDGQVSGLQGLDPALVYDALRRLVNATASRFSVTRRLG